MGFFTVLIGALLVYLICSGVSPFTICAVTALFCVVLVFFIVQVSQKFTVTETSISQSTFFSGTQVKLSAVHGFTKSNDGVCDTFYLVDKSGKFLMSVEAKYQKMDDLLIWMKTKFTDLGTQPNVGNRSFDTFVRDRSSQVTQSKSLPSLTQGTGLLKIVCVPAILFFFCFKFNIFHSAAQIFKVPSLDAFADLSLAIFLILNVFGEGVFLQKTWVNSRKKQIHFFESMEQMEPLIAAKSGRPSSRIYVPIDEKWGIKASVFLVIAAVIKLALHWNR